jgi:hypothetical protein
MTQHPGQKARILKEKVEREPAFRIVSPQGGKQIGVVPEDGFIHDVFETKDRAALRLLPLHRTNIYFALPSFQHGLWSNDLISSAQHGKIGFVPAGARIRITGPDPRSSGSGHKRQPDFPRPGVAIFKLTSIAYVQDNYIIS